MIIDSVCVFCAASLGKNPLYQQAAYEVGKAIAQRQLQLVYGGGSHGLMGIVADAALSHGGYVVGIIPQGLVRKEAKHINLDETYVVESMHERKALMSERAGAYLALPGGYGTLEELLEVTTWAQLGIHTKPIILYNFQGYFDALLQMIHRGVEDGFIRAANPHLIQVAHTVDEIFERMEAYQPEQIPPRWMNEDQI